MGLEFDTGTEDRDWRLGLGLRLGTVGLRIGTVGLRIRPGIGTED